jgi:hypothetical protein
VNVLSFELPLAVVAALGGALAVTSARRGAWIALLMMTTAAALLEFRPSNSLSPALLLRLTAIYGATLYALPAGMLAWRALAHDLHPRHLLATLAEHPVVAVSAAAGLMLGAIPLALPIEGSSVLLRGAGVALLLIGLPPLLTSRYVEATARAAVVTLSGALLLRTSILGALDLFSSIAMAVGFAALLLIGAAVAGQLTKAEEQ